MKMEFKGPTELRDLKGNLIGVFHGVTVTFDEPLSFVPFRFSEANSFGMNVTPLPFVSIPAGGMFIPAEGFVFIPAEGLRYVSAQATTASAIKAEVVVACGDCRAKSSERTLMTSAVHPYEDVCAPCEKARRQRAGVFATTTEKPLERVCGHVEWFDPGKMPIDEHVLANMEIRFENSLCTACTPRVGVGG
jgi:hypothetical protein